MQLKGDVVQIHRLLRTMRGSARCTWPRTRRGCGGGCDVGVPLRGELQGILRKSGQTWPTKCSEHVAFATSVGRALRSSMSFGRVLGEFRHVWTLTQQIQPISSIAWTSACSTCLAAFATFQRSFKSPRTLPTTPEGTPNYPKALGEFAGQRVRQNPVGNFSPALPELAQSSLRSALQGGRERRKVGAIQSGAAAWAPQWERLGARPSCVREAVGSVAPHGQLWGRTTCGGPPGGARDGLRE